MRLVLNSEFQLYESAGKVFCDSLMIAETFEKEHKEILKTIEGETRKDKNGQSFHVDGLLEGLTQSGVKTPDYFIKDSYRDSKNRKQPRYVITKNGFALLVMGFQGQKALRFKLDYINRFNQMEEFISQLLTARMDCPELTDAITCAHELPKSYHYSNELDMINRIVLGCTAKKYKEIHNIPQTVSSIRPYLTHQQIDGITHLQRIDIGLVISGMSFADRKTALTRCHERRLQPLITA